MKREIKFRAWDTILERMEKIPFGENMYWYEENYCDDFDSFEVMQYTGLKDKNGKEIYEGDIITYLDNSHDYGGDGCGNRKGVCKFSEITGSFFFKGDDGDTRDYMNLVRMQEQWSKESGQTASSPFRDGKLVKSMLEIEVIGNIYENPELIDNKE